MHKPTDMNFHELSKLLAQATSEPHEALSQVVVVTSNGDKERDLTRLWSSNLAHAPTSRAHYAQLVSLRKRLTDMIQLIDRIQASSLVSNPKSQG